MTAETTQKQASRWTAVVKKTKRIFNWILGIIFVLLAVFIYFKYFFTYS